MRVNLDRREIHASVRELAAIPPLSGTLLDMHRVYRESTPAKTEVPVDLTLRVDGFAASLSGRMDGLLAQEGRLVVEEVKSTTFALPEHRFQVRLYALFLARAHPGREVRARLVLAGRTEEVDFDPDRTQRELEEKLRQAIAQARRRAALAPALRFPYPEPRPGQEQLMEAVERGLAEGRPVLAHAPTGTGKTVCALLPALRYALARNTRTLFATAKTTQQALAARTLGQLGVQNRVTLEARARVCPACPPCFAPSCPYSETLARARDADAVIGDYNFFYGFCGPNGLEGVIIVDEAHNLFDRAREHYSAFLPRAELADPLLRGRYPAAEQLLEKLASDPSPEGFAALADEAAQFPEIEVLRTVVRIRDLMEDGVAYETEEGAGVICLDPAPRLRERHRRMAGTIAMSATLWPLEHYAEALGLEHPVEVTLPSPFPARSRCVVVVPSIGTRYRERPRYCKRIARTIAEVVAVRPGHYIAYFPSFAFLHAVRPLLPGAVVQGLGTIGQLRTDPRPLLVLAVMGSLLAEGIDLPGEALVGAIIVGPALPPARELANHLGFEHAMLYPGMRRVIQAAGRVHRTPEDVGVIVLLGRRFAQSPYRECLPPDWGGVVANDPVPHLEEFWGMLETGGGASCIRSC